MGVSQPDARRQRSGQSPIRQRFHAGAGTWPQARLGIQNATAQSQSRQVISFTQKPQTYSRIQAKVVWQKLSKLSQPAANSTSRDLFLTRARCSSSLQDQALKRRHPSSACLSLNSPL